MKKIVIYVLENMPYMWVISTIAHELNHAWQFARDEKEKNLIYTEGSANYASYLVLQNYIDKPFAQQLVQQLIDDEDKVYGEGFRRVKYLVDHNGLSYWKDHLAHNYNFPQGY